MNALILNAVWQQEGRNRAYSLISSIESFLQPKLGGWDSKRAKRRWQVGPQAAVLCCAMGIPWDRAWRIPKEAVAKRYCNLGWRGRALVKETLSDHLSYTQLELQASCQPLRSL